MNMKKIVGIVCISLLMLISVFGNQTINESTESNQSNIYAGDGTGLEQGLFNLNFENLGVLIFLSVIFITGLIIALLYTHIPFTIISIIYVFIVYDSTGLVILSLLFLLFFIFSFFIKPKYS